MMFRLEQAVTEPMCSYRIIWNMRPIKKKTQGSNMEQFSGPNEDLIGYLAMTAWAWFIGKRNIPIVLSKVI